MARPDFPARGPGGRSNFGGPRDNRPGDRARPGPRGPGGFDRPGDRRPPPKPPGSPPEIIHRDRDLLVVIKKPGQPTRGAPEHSLVARVNNHLAGRRERYRPVHDLDDVASGAVALVPAREDDDIHDAVRSAVTYLVLAEGVVETGDAPERSLTGPVPGLGAKTSAPVTSLRVIASGNGMSLLRVRARPDAPGQIRAHLASIGHRVVGDTEHGTLRDDLRRVGMHAEEIRLRHPATRTSERYRCPAPASFYRAVDAEPPASAPEDGVTQAQPQGWDQVAGWYDDLISSGSDHHEQTVLPGAERLLDPRPGERVLDVACGQGVLAARLAAHADLGAIVGVDASPALIESARRALGDKATLLVGDARDLRAVLEAHDLEPFDAAACVLALMNIDDLDAVCRGVARALTPGGRFVAVVLHPAFRAPQTTAWGWTADGRTGSPIQFRRVDRYLTERSSEIVMNPGQAAAGKPAVVTLTHHRPVGAYVAALAAAGLMVDAMEEWTSQRRSQPGPRAEAENVARAEIPMFLAIRAVKPA
jgi:23S rRNA-/tRNA-specific pseudouridylate synthase/SAM-dependent methyltransferase